MCNCIAFYCGYDAQFCWLGSSPLSVAKMLVISHWSYIASKWCETTATQLVHQSLTAGGRQFSDGKWKAILWRQVDGNSLTARGRQEDGNFLTASGRQFSYGKWTAIIYDGKRTTISDGKRTYSLPTAVGGCPLG